MKFKTRLALFLFPELKKMLEFCDVLIRCSASRTQLRAAIKSGRTDLRADYDRLINAQQKVMEDYAKWRDLLEQKEKKNEDPSQ